MSPMAWAWRLTLAAIGRTIGGEVRVCEGAGAPLRSGNGNSLADERIGTIADSAPLERRLRAISGVIGTGLFIGFAGLVIVSDGITVTSRHRPSGVS
jgi:ribose 5-phosphate isomerase A